MKRRVTENLSLQLAVDRIPDEFFVEKQLDPTDDPTTTGPINWIVSAVK